MPHTETTRAYDRCGFTSFTRRFSTMMSDHGYEVVLYAGEANEARCSEHVCCIPRAEQEFLLEREGWYRPGAHNWLEFDECLPIWSVFLSNVLETMAERIEPHDIICLASGTQHQIASAFPRHTACETSAAYAGTCTSHRVFPSNAWMHMVYGEQQGCHAANGNFFDAVIPHPADLEEFPAGDGKGDEDGEYFLFMSRMVSRKGYQVAVDATREIGARLLITGSEGGGHEDHVEHMGFVDTERRAHLLGGATAVFMPTLYIEPFGFVATEAQICGTPVISSPFGAFTETVEHGVSGFHCHTLGEFIEATGLVRDLDREAIRERAIGLYTTEAAVPQYDRFFAQLGTLRGPGFYAPSQGLSRPGGLLVAR